MAEQISNQDINGQQPEVHTSANFEDPKRPDTKRRRRMRHTRFGPIRLPHVDDPNHQSGMNIAVWEGFYATIHAVLTGGKFLVGYLYLLGATPFHLGLVNAFPFLFQFSQVAAAYIASHVGSRRKIVILGSGIGRHMWILAIFLPFLPYSTTTKIIIFLVGFAIYNILMIMAGNAWTMWMNDLVPLHVRGRYVAIRGAILVAITIVSDLIGSKILDYFTKLGPEYEKWGFVLLFGIAGLMAFLGTRCFFRQYEPPVKPEPIQNFGRVLKELWRHRSFMNIIRFFFIWNLGLGVSAAFFHPHMLKNLNLDYSGIWFYTMIVGVVGFCSSFVWGKIQDKVGTKPVMLLCGIFICSFPSIWLFATPGRMWPIYLEGVMSGIFWVGFNTAAFNLPLITAPDKSRSYFIAVFGAFTGLSFAIASFTGGIIAEHLINWKFLALGQTFVNFHVLFVLSTVLRITALFFLRRVEEVKARPMGFVLQEIGIGIQKSRYVAKQYLSIPSRWLKINGDSNGQADTKS